MSNVITGNPIIVDTAAATVIVANSFLVQALWWDNGAPANSDTITVKDKNGVVKWNLVLVTVSLAMPTLIEFSVPVLFDGLIVSAMTRGKLYVYLAKTNNLVAT
jgi:hypothetical protein